ncbi:P-loop NTPase fold protein [Flavobacterium sp. NKUCC04_CG]|uniref:KAP family P-loop NTPase fold protein n=1 Tax=Flavobacterium sp. NKUCC04_CG TaxID=2842121 RepID=UPI001C5B3777|nr:P-loop NTPase fold protein [Flavobacterium sp. NKUCC04_CG]MBW3519514.1 KAP family NTPase [Flavobacterium sp. NKUCC04_CG]
MNFSSKYIRTAVYSAIFLFTYWLFYTPINDFIDTWFVKNTWGQLKFDSWLTKIFPLVITALIAYAMDLDFLKKVKYILLLLLVNIIIIVLADLFLFHFWNHLSIGIVPVIFLVLMLFDFVIACKCHTFLVRKATSSDIAKILKENLHGPIWNKEQDTLDFGYQVDRMFQYIQGIKNSQSFVIGINASWGKGKSSFINLLKERITCEERDKHVVIEFNPWKSNSANDVISDFFDEFQRILEKNGLQIGSKLDYYKKLLLGYEGAGVAKSIVGFFQMFFLKEKSTLKSLYDSINLAMEEAGIRFLIIVDDIDRLNNEEVFEVLKLVRNSAMFQNVIFLLAYDKQYVIDSLKSLKIPKPENYLEKIIQKEVGLIYSDELDTFQLCIDYLDKYFKGNYDDRLKKTFREIKTDIILFPENGESSFPEQYSVAKMLRFNNLREIKMFVHNLMYHYLNLKEELNFEEFFILNYIEFRLPEFYKDFTALVLQELDLNSFSSLTEFRLPVIVDLTVKHKLDIATDVNLKLFHYLDQIDPSFNSFRNPHKTYLYFILQEKTDDITQKQINELLVKEDLMIDSYINTSKQINNLLYFIKWGLSNSDEKHKVVEIFRQLLNKNLNCDLLLPSLYSEYNLLIEKVIEIIEEQNSALDLHINNLNIEIKAFFVTDKPCIFRNNFIGNHLRRGVNFKKVSNEYLYKIQQCYLTQALEKKISLEKITTFYRPSIIIENNQPMYKSLLGLVAESRTGFWKYLESHLEELFYKLASPQDNIGKLFTLSEDNMRYFFKDKTQFDEFLGTCVINNKALNDLLKLSEPGVHSFENINGEKIDKSFRVNAAW